MSAPCVLLVDDDATNRFMLSEMLDMLGYAVREAPDGASAIEEAVTHAADIGVILMDIHMPGVSGVEATAQIRSQSEHPPANTPILAVTADQTWVQAGAQGEAGFSGSIAKPVDLTALDRQLRAILLPRSAG